MKMPLRVYMSFGRDLSCPGKSRTKTGEWGCKGWGQRGEKVDECNKSGVSKEAGTGKGDELEDAPGEMRKR